MRRVALAAAVSTVSSCCTSLPACSGLPSATGATLPVTLLTTTTADPIGAANAADNTQNVISPKRKSRCAAAKRPTSTIPECGRETALLLVDRLEHLERPSNAPGLMVPLRAFQRREKSRPPPLGAIVSPNMREIGPLKAKKKAAPKSGPSLNANPSLSAWASEERANSILRKRSLISREHRNRARQFQTETLPGRGSVRDHSASLAQCASIMSGCRRRHGSDSS
jgi:hypothetical protein